MKRASRTHSCLVLARLVLLSLLSFGVGEARAQAPIELDRLVDDLELTERVALLRDPGAELTLAQVQAKPRCFVANEGRALSFGFDYGALWLRFSAHNRGEQPARWILEVSEPTLDHVDLYAVHADGSVEHHQSGDKLAFARRAISHANFVFELRNPARDATTYYLRVQSDDVLRAPVHAWSPHAYTAHHDRDVLLHSWCIGALILVALYHF
jgi:hypothetical protein